MREGQMKIKKLFWRLPYHLLATFLLSTLSHPQNKKLTQTTNLRCLLLGSLSKRQLILLLGAPMKGSPILPCKEKQFGWLIPCQASETVQESITSWKLTGCS